MLTREQLLRIVDAAITAYRSEMDICENTDVNFDIRVAPDGRWMKLEFRIPPDTSAVYGKEEIHKPRIKSIGTQGTASLYDPRDPANHGSTYVNDPNEEMKYRQTLEY